MTIDALVCVASVVVAFYLRLGFWPAINWPLVVAAITAPLLAMPVFVGLRLYWTVFRHVGGSMMWATCRAVLLYGCIYATVFTLWSVPGVPRTVGLIQPGLLLLLLLATRTLAGWLARGAPRRARDRIAQPRMLIYGAGSAGRQLAAALRSGGDIHIVGFVDDDRALHGNRLEGLTIQSPRDLGKIIDHHGISDILLAMPSASRQRRYEVLNRLRAHGVGVRTLPGLTELASGKITVNDLRELDIVDLLGRKPVAPDPSLLTRNIIGKTVLVSGAGGSIGAELCRQIAELAPSKILLMDNSEYALYVIHSELQRSVAQPNMLAPLLASARDPVCVDEIFRTWRPDTIYHAAAYKHVPLVEQNAVEGIRNNVEATRTLAQAARRYGAANFVLISTDKAVRPTNVMGASKRVAELVLQAMAAEGDGPCFSMVRFGNVLGSSGSVVPLFRSQIARGGPLTVTDERITRYFMTISEAAQLVVQAGAMARGGEVFVLDMGEPVKIVDLARAMIELSGLRPRDDDNPDGDIEIVITGLRPGEKLYEELLIGDGAEETSHPRILKANEHFLPQAKLDERLDKLSLSLSSGDPSRIRAALLELVPGYEPSSDVPCLSTLNAA